MGDAMRCRIGFAAALMLAGCVGPARVADPGPPVAPPALLQRDDGVSPMDFFAAVERVAPVAVQFCRERGGGVRCSYALELLTEPGLPANAFQRVDAAGRPIISLTLPLVMGARNIDEIAFILGHEAAHHILGHIPISSRNATREGLSAGMDAALAGQDSEAQRAAETRGALVGARRYSKEFELEADALGAEIAFRAGFDPVRGAAFFNRLPDPGDRFLGTHPPNAARLEVVRRTAAALRAAAPSR
jgi:hypothetical protein